VIGFGRRIARYGGDRLAAGHAYLTTTSHAVKNPLAVTSLVFSLVYAFVLAGQLLGWIEFTLLTSPPVFIGSLVLVLGLIAGGRKLLKSKIPSGRAASYHHFE
jgi:F0F1-type ATP synthase assembly protein I